MKIKHMALYQYFRTSTMTFYIFHLVKRDIFDMDYFKRVNNHIKIYKIENHKNKKLRKIRIT